MKKKKKTIQTTAAEAASMTATKTDIPQTHTHSVEIIIKLRIIGFSTQSAQKNFKLQTVRVLDSIKKIVGSIWHIHGPTLPFRSYENRKKVKKTNQIP